MADCNFTNITAYLAVWHNPRLASLYVVLGIAFSVLYIPCIVSMTFKELWTNNCYKIMFVVGILDIGNLSINAIVPSIFMFIPLSIDCYPLANQILSCWTCQCKSMLCYFELVLEYCSLQFCKYYYWQHDGSYWYMNISARIKILKSEIFQIVALSLSKFACRRIIVAKWRHFWVNSDDGVS